MQQWLAAAQGSPASPRATGAHRHGTSPDNFFCAAHEPSNDFCAHGRHHRRCRDAHFTPALSWILTSFSFWGLYTDTDSHARCCC